MEVDVNEYFEDIRDITVTDQENSQDIELFIIGEFFAPKRRVSKKVMETLKSQYEAQSLSIPYPESSVERRRCGMTSKQAARLIEAMMSRAHGM